jgi:hypothetical protein
MMILMMTCFLRESEVVNLLRSEVQIREIVVSGVAREVAEVYVRKAKNDQAGQGHLIQRKLGTGNEFSIEGCAASRRDLPLGDMITRIV